MRRNTNDPCGRFVKGLKTFSNIGFGTAGSRKTLQKTAAPLYTKTLITAFLTVSAFGFAA